MRYISNFIVTILVLFIFNSSALAVSPPYLYLSFTPTPAIEYNLPYPGILPDHPLYPLKALRDRILLFFTQDPVKKIHLNLLFADKRMVMGQFLWEKGITDSSISTISKAEKYLLSAALDLMPLKKQNNLPPGLSDKLELAAKKHEQIIMKLLDNISEETKKQDLDQALGINHQAMQQILVIK